MKNAIIFSLFILLGDGDMRLILVIFALFISQNAWSISCTEDYQKRGDDNFSFPDANYMIDRSVNGKICYKGRDVTGWATGDGMEATSFIFPEKNKALALITLNEINPASYKAKSRIRVILINSLGQPVKYDFIKENYSNEHPEKELTDMRFTSYDFEKGIVYFESPAWATSMAIHAFEVPFDGDYSKVKEKFIIDGSIKYHVMSTMTLKDKEDFFRYLIVTRGVYKEGKGRKY
ncbi:hypothetical protein Q4R57_08620, partial [Morganella morganii]